VITTCRGKGNADSGLMQRHARAMIGVKVEIDDCLRKEYVQMVLGELWRALRNSSKLRNLLCLS